MNRVAIKRRIDMDLHRRSIVGVLLYALMLPAVFWPFDFYSLQPDLSIAFALGMLVVSLARLFFYSITAYVYQLSPKLWLSIFSILSLTHACILGVFFCMSIYDARFEQILHVTMLAIGGVASSALTSLTPRIKLALLNLGCLLIPSIIVGLLTDGKLPYSLMIVVYACFIATMGLRASREYKRSFEIETQLHEQKKALEKINKIDALTGIYNRGYFNHEYDKQWHSNARHDIQTSLLLIDIDHFKTFNDIHGHLCGDACIVHVANLIAATIARKTDLVARFGGEEFIVLLSDCNQEEAMGVAEKVRNNIEFGLFSYEDKQQSVTVSIGVASTLPNTLLDKNLLIEAADKAMYAAKHMGRNCVSAHRPIA